MTGSFLGSRLAICTILFFGSDALSAMKSGDTVEESLARLVTSFNNVLDPTADAIEFDLRASVGAGLQANAIVLEKSVALAAAPLHVSSVALGKTIDFTLATLQTISDCAEVFQDSLAGTHQLSAEETYDQITQMAIVGAKLQCGGKLPDKLDTASVVQFAAALGNDFARKLGEDMTKVYDPDGSYTWAMKKGTGKDLNGNLDRVLGKQNKWDTPSSLDKATELREIRFAKRIESLQESVDHLKQQLSYGQEIPEDRIAKIQEEIQQYYARAADGVKFGEKGGAAVCSTSEHEWKRTLDSYIAYGQKKAKLVDLKNAVPDMQKAIHGLLMTSSTDIADAQFHTFSGAYDIAAKLGSNVRDAFDPRGVVTKKNVEGALIKSIATFNNLAGYILSFQLFPS